MLEQARERTGRFRRRRLAEEVIDGAGRLDRLGIVAFAGSGVATG